MISEFDQNANDYDWFFSCNEYIGFVASGGGRLPNSVSILDNKNEILISYFRNLPVISEVELNSDLPKNIVEKFNDRYIRDFVFMAQKGLFAYDKSVLNNFSSTIYHLVAKPITPLKTINLTSEIRNLLGTKMLNVYLNSVSQIDISVIQ